MTTVNQVIKIIDAIAPFSLAEPWDNSGLQVGNPDWSVSGIVIGLDVTLPLMEYAKQNALNLVITHHPLMISPEKKIDFSRLPGAVIEWAAKYQIAVISAHTNLDKATNGLNDYFAEKIGLLHCMNDLISSAGSDGEQGIGRVCELKRPERLKDLAFQIKKTLGLDHIRFTGDGNLKLKTAAVCTGSGGSLLEDFFKTGADVFITGDIKYHDARQVEEHGKGLIDVGHFGSEHMAISLLYEKLSAQLSKAGTELNIEQFKEEKDPFNIV